MKTPTPTVKITHNPWSGEMEVVYIKIRDGIVYETRDADENGNAYADYDENGVLLGIELLGPCELTVLDKLAEEGPQPFEKISRYVPHGMVCNV